MIPRIPTRAASFRVFHGYQRPGLAEADFLSELGEVFMPGTPLMVRDLGLAAYLPAVLPVPDGVSGLPDEVAIIAYASRDAYTHARNDTVTGRMYTHTHRAVFDMERSRSQYAEELGPLVDPVTAFWCTGEAADWQADGDVLIWAGYTKGDASGFGQRFLDDVGGLMSSLGDAGVHECVGQAGPNWGSLWLLLDGFGDAPAVNELLRPGPAGTTELLLERATRLVWRDQPPAAPVTRGSAWSYVFVRDASRFIE